MMKLKTVFIAIKLLIQFLLSRTFGNIYIYLVSSQKIPITLWLYIFSCNVLGNILSPPPPPLPQWAENANI